MELINFLEDIKANEKAFNYLGSPTNLIDGFIQDLQTYEETINIVNKFYPEEKVYDSFYIRDGEIKYFSPIGKVYETDFSQLKRTRRLDEKMILIFQDKTIVLDETFDIYMILPTCDDIVINDNIYLLKDNIIYKYDKNDGTYETYFAYKESNITIYSISFDRENLLVYLNDGSNYRIDKIVDGFHETIIQFNIKNDYNENSKLDFYYKEFVSTDEEGNEITTYEDYILISSLEAVDEYKLIDVYVYNKSYSKPRELQGSIEIKDYSYYNNKIALALENKILILSCDTNNLYNILGTEVLVQEEDKYYLDSTINIIGVQLNKYNVSYIDNSLNKIVSLPIDYKKEVDITYNGDLTGIIVTNPFDNFNVDKKELTIKVGDNIPKVILIEVRK